MTSRDRILAAAPQHVGGGDDHRDRDLDLDLGKAFRSVQDVYDGTNAESTATLQRALFRTRKRERKQRFTRWIVLPAAAVLIVSSAWAGVTGHLPPIVHSTLEMLELVKDDQEPPPAPVATPHAAAATPSASADPAPSEQEPANEPEREEAKEVAAPPAPIAAPAPAPTPARSTPQNTKQGTSAKAPEPDPHAALFAEAHRLHFAERDPARALAAWERYLAAAPNGRFTPEARYNHALALVRLGRRDEARTELSAFANGVYGNYRREEAAALVTALASAP